MKKYSSLVLLLFFVVHGITQSRTDLENQRLQIIKSIELAQNSLNKTSKTKNEKLKELDLIQNKITQRESLINNLKSSISEADASIAANNELLIKLKSNSQEIEDQYNKLLRYSYLKKLATNKWSYILSSQNLNNAFLRWRYMKQFEQFCKDKASEIIELQTEIDAKNSEIELTKKDQANLLSSQSSQYNLLREEKSDMDEILKEINKDEQKWKNELSKANRERERLNKAIENVIVAELKKRKEPSSVESTATIALSETFSENRGKFSWPVQNGYISGKFGIQPHPSLKGVKINNNGIDIRSSPGSKVISIHNGKVIGVTQIPGYDNMVIVQHGDFYTVYSKLTSVVVTKDDEVKAGTVLGALSPEDGSLHFEVWKKKTKEDPAKWLRNP